MGEKSLPVCLEEVDYPTGVVNVTLDADGVPCYDIVEGVAYDNIHWTEALEDLARNTCAVCFGTLAQRNTTSRNTILLFLDTMPSEGTLKIYDINLRQHYYSKEIVEASLQKSNILKINDEELSVVNAMFEMGDIPAKESCRRLMDRFGLDVLILTCGVNGSYVFAEDTVSFLGTPKVKVPTPSVPAIHSPPPCVQACSLGSPSPKRTRPPWRSLHTSAPATAPCRSCLPKSPHP